MARSTLWRWVRQSRREALPLSRHTRLLLEPLEERIVPAVNWVNANGGAWNVGANWDTGSVPGPNDDVVINLSNTSAVMMRSTESRRGDQVWENLSIDAASIETGSSVTARARVLI